MDADLLLYHKDFNSLLGIEEEKKSGRRKRKKERKKRKEEKVIGQLMVCPNQRSMKREVAVLKKSVNRENEETKKKI